MDFQDLIANYQLSDHLYLWLAVAFLGGLLFGIGWGRAMSRSKSRSRQREAAAPPPAMPPETTATPVKAGEAAAPASDAGPSVGDLVGIKPQHVEKLVGVGIESIDDLLSAAGDRSQREALADRLQLEDFVINKWVRMAKFLHIPELSPEVAEFLVFAGIGTPADLADSNAESLAHKLQHLNDQEQRIEQPPTRQQIESWKAHLSDN